MRTNKLRARETQPSNLVEHLDASGDLPRLKEPNVRHDVVGERVGDVGHVPERAKILASAATSCSGKEETYLNVLDTSLKGYLLRALLMLSFACSGVRMMRSHKTTEFGVCETRRRVSGGNRGRRVAQGRDVPTEG